MKLYAADILMDLVLALAAQLCFGRFDARRLAITLLFMQMVTLLYLCFGSFLRHPALIALQALGISGLVLGKCRFRKRLGCAAFVFCAAACAGGGMNIACIQHPAAGAAAVIILLFLAAPRRNIRYRWNIDVYLKSGGKQARIAALIDTGNRLREPISNRPVLIVEADALTEAFFEGKKLRMLRFGVLGSCGEIPAFRPDEVLICGPAGTLLSAPECFVAVYPGRIPGTARALAPPEFTEVL